MEVLVLSPIKSTGVATNVVPDVSLVEHPLGLLFFLLYTLLIIGVSSYRAEVLLRRNWRNLHIMSAEWFFHTQTKYQPYAVWCSLVLNEACLLSNVGVFKSINLVHLGFYTLSLVVWTFAFKGSRSLKPIQWNLYTVSRRLFYGYALTAGYVVYMGAYEVFLFFGYGDPERLVISQVLFFVTLVIYLLSFLLIIRWFTATKLLVSNQNGIICSLIRDANGYRFEVYYRSAPDDVENNQPEER